MLHHRLALYEVITDDSDISSDNFWAHIYDAFMICCILVSLMPLCFKEQTEEMLLVEWMTTIVFLLDYLMRWICADYIMLGKHFLGHHVLDNRLAFAAYPFTLLAIVDLLSIVPTFMHASQLLRLSRLVRLLRVMRAIKLVHHSRSVQLVLRVLQRERDALLAVLMLAMGYVFISALVMFNVEPETFTTFFDALYWAVISLSTIGYGDLYATTVAGRVVSMISALMGIAVVALPSGIITAGFVEELRNMEHAKKPWEW